MKTTLMTLLAGAMSLTLFGAPALAVPPADDLHLHVVHTSQDVLVERDIIVGRRHARRGGWRETIIAPGKAYDAYIAQGPFRLSESAFLGLLESTGAAPDLIQRVRTRQASANWHGLLATGGWIGALVAGAVAEAQLGPDAGLVERTSTSQVVVNTAGITALAFAVAGVIYTYMYLGDTAPVGAPYFRAFNEADATRAIADYNRRLDRERASSEERHL